MWPSPFRDLGDDHELPGAAIRAALQVYVEHALGSRAQLMRFGRPGRFRLARQPAGLFIGGTIHDVSQVVGAGCSLRREAGNYAGVVKLFRVSVLAVVVAVSSVFKAERRRVQSETAAGTAPARQSLVRWFLRLFFAIAAPGIKASFMQLARAGCRPFVPLPVEKLLMPELVFARWSSRGTGLRAGPPRRGSPRPQPRWRPALAR